MGLSVQRRSRSVTWRGRLLVPALGLSLMAAGAAAGPAGDDAPNVIVILLDALRADHLGCYGYDHSTSPRIDGLAAGGVLFESAFSQASWTKPSIPSLFTGLYPIEHHVFTGSKTDRPGLISSDVLREEHATMAELFEAFGYSTGAFVHNTQISSFMGFSQGFDVYEEELGDAANVTDAFLRWLDTKPPAPFLTYMHFIDPHWPYAPPEEWRSALSPGGLDLDHANWKALKVLIDDAPSELDDRDRQALELRYDDCIRFNDHWVGRVLDELAARGLSDDTIVLFTSDHGEEFFDHGRLGHGTSLHDELLHVPLILHVPGGHTTRISAQVQLIDVLPTLLELTDLPIPGVVSGRSLVPLLNGQEQAARPAFADHRPQGRAGHLLQSVRFDGYKCIRAYAPAADIASTTSDYDRPNVEIGMWLEVDGVMSRSGRMLALEIERIDPEDHVKVSGPIHSVDKDTRLFQLLGHRCRLEPGVKYKNTELDYVAPVDLTPGLWIQAKGDFDSDGIFAIRRIKLLPESKHEEELKAMVEAVRLLEDDEMLITVAGIDVEITSDTEFEGEWPTVDGGPPAKPEPHHSTQADPLPEDQDAMEERPLLRVELYDLANDPDEQNDIAARHPELVRELSALLDDWQAGYEDHTGHTPEEVVLDRATIERLRSLGYID